MPQLGWVPLGELTAGTTLHTTWGQGALVVGSTWRPARVPDMNLEVEEEHTYFVRGAGVDEPGVLVHNMCAKVSKGARAGQNDVPGPVRLETRTTRDGSGGARLTYPDGSVKDVTEKRVKEFVPETDPRAPKGTPRAVKFDDPQPGTKGKKRDPTPEDLREAGLQQ